MKSLQLVHVYLLLRPANSQTFRLIWLGDLGNHVSKAMSPTLSDYCRAGARLTI